MSQVHFHSITKTQARSQNKLSSQNRTLGYVLPSVTLPHMYCCLHYLYPFSNGFHLRLFLLSKSSNILELPIFFQL
uniref:Uncharacterized protein n=1 Tax=Anguilla anguilla TaxID=7936 RepID=A0A0E9XKQ6_ANGAN